MVDVKGGDKFEARITEITTLATNASSVGVGFLAEAKYPDGTPVAMIAAIHNWGAPRANIPPRPFFSNMIADKGPEWGPALGELLVDNGYDALRSLQLAGEGIAGQLRQAIHDMNAPALAPATIQRKGFAKPLIDSAHMFNSVDYEVKA